MEKEKREIVSRDKMSEAGVYFGQRTSMWNPKMKPYILAAKNRVHIIDVMKTKKTLEFSYSLIKRYAEKGASFIFVGTRKQAKETIKENALRTNSFYVSERWLGGTLTNARTIFQRVKRMQELEKLAEKKYKGYTKKEGLEFDKELAKLQRNLNGIRNMRQKPQVMIIADPMTDIIAVKEAKKLGIKVFGIVDTNVDPSIVDVAIPGNDDSIKSVTLIITILADAIADAKNGEIKFAYQPDEKVILPNDLVPEWKKKREVNRRKWEERRRNFKKEDGQDKEVRTETPKPKSTTSQKTTAKEIKPETVTPKVEKSKTTTKATSTTKTTAKKTTKSVAKKATTKTTKSITKKDSTKTTVKKAATKTTKSKAAKPTTKKATTKKVVTKPAAKKAATKTTKSKATKTTTKKVATKPVAKKAAIKTTKAKATKSTAKKATTKTTKAKATKPTTKATAKKTATKTIKSKAAKATTKKKATKTTTKKVATKPVAKKATTKTTKAKPTKKAGKKSAKTKAATKKTKKAKK